jgi:hypothetical protein
MSTREARARWAALALVMAAAGCAAPAVTRIPPGWLPAPDDALEHADGYGAWASVGYRDGFHGQRLEGELIAADADSTWVLDEGRLVACRTRSIVHAHLFVAHVSGARDDDRLIGGGDWKRMRVWARFPQGLPPGLDRAAIRPKPPRRR